MIELPVDQIRDFCESWRIKEFSIFGSAMRDDFSPDSDIDVLVMFQPDAPRYGMFDMVRMEQALRDLFGRDVDLLEKQTVQQSENYIRRKSILESAKVVYAA